MITDVDANMEDPESDTTPPVVGSIVNRCKDCIKIGTIKCKICKEDVKRNTLEHTAIIITIKTKDIIDGNL